MAPPCGDHVTADVPLTQQKIIMLDQPCPGTRHKVDLVEHGGRFPTKISDKPTFRMRGEFAASEQPERRGMMLKQRASAPAIEGPDRGYPRRCAIELSTEAIKDFRRNALHRIKRVAGHL